MIDNCDVLHGQWPAAYDELVLALDRNNEIAVSALYALGLKVKDLVIALRTE